VRDSYNLLFVFSNTHNTMLEHNIHTMPPDIRQWSTVNASQFRKVWETIMFLLINLNEVGQEVDPNPDGGTVCMVI
jgi:hypothetical protein